MTLNSILSKDNLEKLGNTVVFMTQKCSNMSKTKLLKLLYYMEEYYAVRCKAPFLGLTYKVWQAGPVADAVYCDIADGAPSLGRFISLSIKNNNIYITPKQDFCADEFSDCEIQMMEDIVKKYGSKSAKELVWLSHRPNTLWYRTAKRHNLLTEFDEGNITTSDTTIDFTEIMTACGAEAYRDAYDDWAAANHYNKIHVHV